MPIFWTREKPYQNEREPGTTQLIDESQQITQEASARFEQVHCRTKSEDRSLEFALHCAAHINKRGLKELPPFSPRTEDEASAPETVNKLQSEAKEKETPETQWKQWPTCKVCRDGRKMG